MRKNLFKSTLTWGILTALVMGACTDSETLSDGLNIGTTGAPEDALSFSTYLGRSKKETRAGATGNIDTEVLKGADYGFGVFAFYTGTDNYTDFRTQNGAGKTSYPNFMYNQKVTYNPTSTSEITKWEYSPIKYWPNDVQNGKVDDQENDENTKPATSSEKYGGKVSFFAYAPYVEVSQGGSPALIDNGIPTTGSTTTGILKLSGNKWNGASSQDRFSDPYLLYAIPTNYSDDFVDLLWGTKGGTNQNVNNESNKGVTGPGVQGVSTTDYASTLLEKYVTNADLTKQTTTGVIGFLFKHALSKVGGSYQGDEEGDDEDKNTPTNGLMVVLDLDDEGEESGADLEAFDTPLNDKTPYKTKVTIRDIQITAKMLQKDADGKKPGQDGYTPTYYKTNQGYLNLATGQWDFSSVNESTDNSDEALTITHNVTSNSSETAVQTASSGELSENIAEPSSVSEGATGFANDLPIGVTTTPKNVYEDEGNALVFFPQTYPELTITIDYLVRTYDLNLANEYSAVGQKITKTLTFTNPVELNKMYNILIHLGLTSVKFTATVDDWDVNPAETSSTTESGTEVTTTETIVDYDVYVPRNVKNAVASMALEPASGSADFTTVPVAGSTTGLALTATATYENVNSAPSVVTSNATYTVTYPDPTTGTGWVHVAADGTVTVDENKVNSAKARTATITATYGGVTSPAVTLNQYSNYVAAVRIMNAGSGAATTATLSPAGGTYNLADDNKYIAAYVSTRDKTGGEVSGSWKNVNSKDPQLVITEDNDNVVKRTNGLNFTYNYNISGADKTVKYKAQYMGKESDNEVTATQATATLNSITTNIGTAQTISYSGGTVTLNKIIAHFEGISEGIDVTKSSSVSVSLNSYAGSSFDTYTPTNTLTTDGKWTLTVTSQNLTDANKQMKITTSYTNGGTQSEECIVTQKKK